MYPAAGQTGCTYTGSAGGPTWTEIPTAICAGEAAGIPSIMAVNTINTSNLAMRIIVTSL
jgi:hypothetical protein